jgi:hypothetical protein
VRLNAHDLIGLRRLADDAQRDGHFDDAETLRELLASAEAVDKVGGIEEVRAAVERAAEADDLEDSLEEVTAALETAASEAEAEAGNFDDVQIAVGAEIDRLEAISKEAADGYAAEQILDAVNGLKDVVETLRGQRDRLKDTAKRAREALR